MVVLCRRGHECGALLSSRRRARVDRSHGSRHFAGMRPGRGVYCRCYIPPLTPPPKRNSVVLRRRRFLVHVSTALTALLVGCGRRPVDRNRALSVLVSTSEIVLPSDLSYAQRKRIVEDFWVWVEGYSPAAERRRPWGMPRLKFPLKAPDSPESRYLQQLARLSGATEELFESLDAHRREMLVRDQLEDHLPSGFSTLPWPGALVGEPGDHVLVSLASYYLYSKDGRNRAARGLVDPYVCQPLDNVRERPRAVV